jgi:hypothetical protein
MNFAFFAPVMELKNKEYLTACAKWLIFVEIRMILPKIILFYRK